MASLRHRNAAATSVRVGALEAADELRSSHQRANTLFRRVFVTLALVLTAARVLLCFYGLTSPFSLPHHAEAHMTLGPWFALLELVGAFSLLVCAAHFVRSVPKAVSVVLALNVVLALLVAFVPGHEGWLSERGWWFALYFGGFGAFFCMVTLYSNSLITEDLSAQIDSLLASQPGIQHV